MSRPDSAMPSLRTAWSRHELDAFLDEAAAAEQQLLLDRVLGVVTRVHLVRAEMNQVEPRGRHVDVDDDAAAAVAEVVVERPPRLVVDRLERHLLAWRQVEQRGGALTEDRQQVAERGD